MLLALRQRGSERGSRALQSARNRHCDRVRAAENTTHGPFRLLERRHGLALIFKRRAVSVERHRVNSPHPERELMTLAENASSRGYHFAQQ